MTNKTARLVPRLRYGQILKMAVNTDDTVDLVLHLKVPDCEDLKKMRAARDPGPA